MAHLKDRLMFGGVNLSQWLEGISIERSIMPDVNINTISVPGRDGVILNGHTHAPLVITVTATLSAKKATDVATVRHALAEALLSDKDNPLKPLVLPDDPNITYDAMVNGSTTLSRDYGYPRVNLEFYVPSGYGYGEEITRTVPFTTTITGNVPTWPIVTLRGSASQTLTVIRRDSTGQETIICKGGTTVVVDTENESVTTLSGESVVFDLSSDFFDFKPGSVTVDSGGGSATVTWRPRWV